MAKEIELAAPGFQQIPVQIRVRRILRERVTRIVDGLVIADGPGRQVAMANAEALGAEALAQFLAAEKAQAAAAAAAKPAE